MVEVVKTAAALVVGSELLNGKVSELNLVELARTLRALGVPLGRAVMVPDARGEIARELRALAGQYDVVFTSGGVGPTHDDVTVDAVAEAFDVDVVSDPLLEELISSAYGPRCTESHLRMARIPAGATLVRSHDITWPVTVMQNVWLLPGVPEVFRMKLSIVREHIRGPLAFTSRAAFLNLEEADIKPLLDRTVAAHPSVEIGSYPKWFDSSYRTKVTFDAVKPALAEAALTTFLELLPEGEPQRIE